MENCSKEETKDLLKLKEENENLKKENAEKEYQINYLKEQIEKLSNETVLLPDSPIDCAALLISSGFDYETSQVQRLFGAGEKSRARLYSIPDLYQIAKHLLVYCEYNEDEKVE